MDFSNGATTELGDILLQIARQEEAERHRQDPEIMRRFEQRCAEYEAVGFDPGSALEVAAWNTRITIGDMGFSLHPPDPLNSLVDYGPVARFPPDSPEGLQAVERRTRWLIDRGIAADTALEIAQVEIFGFEDDLESFHEGRAISHPPL